MHDKFVQHAEVVSALFWPGQDERQNLIFVGRIHQNAEQIEQLFRRTDTAREDDDAVGDTDKRLKAFFDIRHNNQFVNQRVRRLSGDNGRFGHADKAPLFVTLLSVSHRRAFHWRFHRAGPATGANVQLTQAELRSHTACVEIFGFVNRVTTPADDHIRCLANMQGTGVTQNGEHQVGDMNGAFEVKMLETASVMDLSVNEQDVTQHRKQVGLQRTDNSPVDKSLFRRVDDFEFYTTLPAQHVDIKTFKAGQQLFAVICQTSGVQYGK